MANVLASFPGYDTSWGNKKVWQGHLIGPTSYVTGGIAFTASALGWGGIEFLVADNWQVATVNSQTILIPASLSGNYFVGIKLASTASGAVASFTIQWYVTSTGAEVGAAVNLSAEKVRLLAVGV
jgi:hypothetical protein